ncbi:MAG TPA: hypothetical protein VGM23_04310, partial [Armatimonadota bacterium]
MDTRHARGNDEHMVVFNTIGVECAWERYGDAIPVYCAAGAGGVVLAGGGNLLIPPLILQVGSRVVLC